MINDIPARPTPLVSRRTALAGLSAGVLTALAARGRNVSAQGATATPTPTGAVGITIQFLGSGAPTSAPGLELTLRRTVLVPGGRLPDHTHPGALVILVESGTFGYTALGGPARLTRGPVSQARLTAWYQYPEVYPTRPPGAEVPAQTVDLPIGAEVLLSAGDWLFVDDPRDDIRNAGQVDVVLLVAGLTRVGEPFTTFMAELEMGATPAP